MQPSWPDLTWRLNFTARTEEEKKQSKSFQPCFCHIISCRLLYSIHKLINFGKCGGFSRKQGLEKYEFKRKKIWCSDVQWSVLSVAVAVLPCWLIIYVVSLLFGSKKINCSSSCGLRASNDRNFRWDCPLSDFTKLLWLRGNQRKMNLFIFADR